MESAWKIDYPVAIQQIQNSIGAQRDLEAYFSYLIHQAFAPQLDDTHIPAFVEFISANIRCFDCVYSKVMLLFRNIIAFSDAAAYFIGNNIKAYYPQSPDNLVPYAQLLVALCKHQIDVSEQIS